MTNGVLYRNISQAEGPPKTGGPFCHKFPLAKSEQAFCNKINRTDIRRKEVPHEPAQMLCLPGLEERLCLGGVRGPGPGPPHHQPGGGR